MHVMVSDPNRHRTARVLRFLLPQRPPLPVALSSFVGRERELAELRQRLQMVRLLTLTGAGGSGKTRLALELATTVESEFADGVLLVSLAPISNPLLVVSAAAQALGVQEQGGRPLLETITDALEQQDLLLLLDNFEQVAEAAPLLGGLLRSCPHLRLLVTSRAVLHISGEQVYPVAPLALPDPAISGSVELLGRCEAVQLFVERARAVRHDFALTAHNALAVAQICYRLDGLPLAIELAAARSRILSPQALLARLSSRLQLLTGGTRDLPARQRTLRETIAWSYDLLSEPEQVLFRRLAVFVGGCTLEAADEVAGERGKGPGIVEDPHLVASSEAGLSGSPHTSVLDRMASLVDKSLLRQEEQTDGEPRFAMLETLREFAQERLETSGEAQAIRHRHMASYLAFAEARAGRLGGAERKASLDKLGADYDNLRAALGWLVEGGAADLALRLAAALVPFWDLRQDLTEGRRSLEIVLALPDATALTSARADCLRGAGRLATRQGDLTAAQPYLEASLALCGDLDDKRGMARSLGALGFVAHRRGDYKESRRLRDEGAALAREVGDRAALVTLLDALGWVALAQGDLPAARSVAEETEALCRELRDRWTAAHPRMLLGEIARSSGDYDLAARLYQESLDLHRQVAHKQGAAICLHNLGHVAIHQGDLQRARARLAESLDLGREIGDTYHLAMCCAAVAGIAVRSGRARQAAQLCAAAVAALDGIGARLETVDLDEFSRNQSLARDQLGKAAFDADWAEGRAMSLDQAIACALAIVAGETSGAEPEALPAGAAPPESVRPHGLSKREVEVLQLIAAGRTNQEIAEALVLSPGTVARHTANIYIKIDVRSRAEAVAYAVRQSLT